jgi:hypothetical protein
MAHELRGVQRQSRPRLAPTAFEKVASEASLRRPSSGMETGEQALAS